MEPPEKKEQSESAFAVWLIETLGVPREFLKGEVPSDDWTLIIRLHSIVEAALNKTILQVLEFPVLEPILEKLDTSNKSTGKVAFAKALGLLDSDHLAFIQKFSELRNFCVHHARNFHFSLADYLAGMKQPSREALIKIYAFEQRKLPKNSLLETAAMNMVRENPSRGVFLGAMKVLLRLYFRQHPEKWLAQEWPWPNPANPKE